MDSTPLDVRLRKVLLQTGTLHFVRKAEERWIDRRHFSRQERMHTKQHILQRCAFQFLQKNHTKKGAFHSQQIATYFCFNGLCVRMLEVQFEPKIAIVGASL